MPDVDTDLYSATMAALTAQRAAYANYRLIIDGLQIAVERPTRRVVPYLIEQLSNTVAEIDERWTELFAAHRTVSEESDGPLVQKFRAFFALVLQDAERTQFSVQRLGRHLESRGAGIRMPLGTAFESTDVGGDGT